MEKQQTHYPSCILKRFPEELLWHKNPAVSQLPSGSQACQNSSGAYPSAGK